jgi:hypothetical protein
MLTFHRKIVFTASLLVTITSSSFAFESCPEPYNSATWHNCIGSLTLLEGMTLVNTGDFYEGEWRNGKPHGRGKVTFPETGGYYIGNLKDGLAHGKGTLVDTHYKYVGEWKNDKRNGFGKAILTDQIYEGEWKNDTLHGYGTVTFTNGNKYVGEWKNDKRNGYGTDTSLNGNKYVGEWKNDKQNGFGTFTEFNGYKYVGEWKNGQRNGKGTHTWTNGNKYVGQSKNDKRTGFGTSYHADGRTYVGEHNQNQITGIGKATLLDGSILEGYFVEGMLKKPIGSPLKLGFNSRPIIDKIDIQIKLSNIGFYKSKIDGLYGPATKAALINWNNQILEKSENDLKSTSSVEHLLTSITSPTTLTKQKNNVTIFDLLGAFAEGYNAVDQGFQGSSTPPVATQTCFKTGDYRSGFNKICNYDCLGSAYAMTISSTSLCPLMVNR